jgi:hypothetical protein
METATVPQVLRAYADRGVLRRFQTLGSKPERDFGFLWLNHKPLRLQWKPDEQTIVFKDFASNIPARSAMYREIRAFLEGRTEADLPAHRRVDPAEFELICQNRKSQLSIGLKILNGSEEAATRKLMLVIHETFLFMADQWQDYMHEEFGTSLE